MTVPLACPLGHRWEAPEPGGPCPVCGSAGVPAGPPGAGSTIVQHHPPHEAPTLTPPSPAPDGSGSTLVSGDGPPPAPGATVTGTPTPPTAADPPPLQFVEGYEILGQVGRGGMGVVYRARQAGLNRVVAIKTILAGAHASDEELQRFRAEAEAVARLRHENIVQIYQVGTAEHGGSRFPYMALKFLDGGGLDRQLAGTPWPARKAGELVETPARAVHSAHLAGVIHRDLKPANVLLTADGRPKVSDFGLAKRLDDASGQTASGSVLGTPSCMTRSRPAATPGRSARPPTCTPSGRFCMSCSPAARRSRPRPPGTPSGR